MTDQLRRAEGDSEELSFTEVFAHALRGHPCRVVGLDDAPEDLPLETWARPADAHDRALLDLCHGPTIDIGCGPGRMTAALAERGHLALGIDVVPEAVGQTVDRGASALQRDVFDRLPGEGRWETALLADGNVGIGGDPVALLRRVRELLHPLGRVVVEVEAPGVPAKTAWAALECDGVHSRPFLWSVVGVDDLGGLAAEAGLHVVDSAELGGRWVAVLEGAA